MLLMINQAPEKVVKNNGYHHIISKLYRVMETAALINSTKDMQLLIYLILKAVIEVMEVEASTLARVDTHSNELYFSDTAGGSNQIKNIRLKIGQGIAGHVAHTGQPMIVNDVSKSKYHYFDADHQTKFNTRSILCVPLIVRERVIGILQALNKKDASGFTQEDLRIFNAFASQVAVALENARLNDLAIYDELTGIHNRRYFNIWIQQEFNRVKRFESNLSLIMIDIDHFKKVNDNHGHLAGDYVLVKLVNTLKQQIQREADLFVRYGGEEFLIILQETSLPQAYLLAEKFRSSIEQTKFVYNTEIIPVQISLGVVNYQENPVQTVEQLLQRVDEMLYKAKALGRNQVQIYLSN